MILHVDNEDSDQTAQMRRLILVFVGRTKGTFSHVAAHFCFQLFCCLGQLQHRRFQYVKMWTHKRAHF